MLRTLKCSFFTYKTIIEVNVIYGRPKNEMLFEGTARLSSSTGQEFGTTQELCNTKITTTTTNKLKKNNPQTSKREQSKQKRTPRLQDIEIQSENGALK